MALAEGRIDPSFEKRERVRFRFDGRWIEAFEGDTVASALHAAGVRTLSRSFKYHRPRGLLCAAGRCPNCLVNVDGVPHVRACVTPLRDGMEVRPQRGWPSVNLDVLRILDRLPLPVGFYYKTFIKPKRFWPLYEKVLRHVAGFGELDHEHPPEGRYSREHRYADVAVVGGGPAGMRAAIAAAKAGADVVLIDDQAQLGGHLLLRTENFQGSDLAAEPGYEVARALAAEAERTPNVEIVQNATAFGLYEDHLLGVLQAERLIELRTERLIVATGRQEYLPAFVNNDLPGIMLGTAAQRLIRFHAVRPGRRAVVVSANEQGLAVAGDLHAAGVTVAAVAELRPDIPETAVLQKLLNAHIPIYKEHSILEAVGKDSVRGVALDHIEAGGQLVASGQTIRIDCDLVCLSVGFETQTALLHQSGCSISFDEDLAEFVPTKLAPNVFAAGDVTGTHYDDAVLLEGELAGLEAARSLGFEAASSGAEIEQRRTKLDELRRTHAVSPAPLPPSIPAHRKQFACLCEDVTNKELADAIHEGFDGLEYLKRYTTYSMGPCQGKMCAMSSTMICARELHRSIGDMGNTTSRPPIQPVPLGALAGPVLHPTKISPMHHRHEALRAAMIDSGAWLRPRNYPSGVEAEVQAVRQAVGVIDISTLGKLEVVGPDSAELLELVLVNKVGDLKIGRLRYWLLCDEAGIILDEGTVIRTSPDAFFLTASSGGVSGTESWLSWQLAGTEQRVSIVNRTDGMAAINVAGPRARELLAPLTDVDLSAEAFPYLTSRRGLVAGVPILLLKTGFVGELSFEIHAPAEYGSFLWDTLLEAGQAYGIQPFGLEAQRVLRLEKGHLIAGVDTDALSNPLEADMAWTVKFDKQDFVGKASLLDVSGRGGNQQLVGYAMHDWRVVPDDGSAIVLDGRPVGRVTSARFSSTLGRSIGLGWVPVECASEGSTFSVLVNSKPEEARVVSRPFYDPDGARMKA